MVKKHAASDTSSHLNTEVKCNLDRTVLALVTAWELTGAARMGFDTAKRQVDTVKSMHHPSVAHVLLGSWQM